MPTHAKSHHPFSPFPPNNNCEVHKPVLFQSGYSQSNHHKRYFYITKSKISYSLIEPQLLPCTPNCGYKFHALPIYQQPTFTTPTIRGAFGIQPNIFDGVFFANIVNLLRPLAIFTEELHRRHFARF